MGHKYLAIIVLGENTLRNLFFRNTQIHSFNFYLKMTISIMRSNVMINCLGRPESFCWRIRFFKNIGDQNTWSHYWRSSFFGRKYWLKNGFGNCKSYIILFYLFFQTGHTALQRCAAEGQMEVVKQLIGRGCPIDHQDDVVRFLAFFSFILEKKFFSNTSHDSRQTNLVV